jgi:Fur family transcriptional regulator, peroxide stress response regulator
LIDKDFLLAKKQITRMTRQRQVILEELRRLDFHPSADEVYDLVRKRLPRISLGTVYRNLETLSELGEIQKLEFGGTIKRFDGITEPHYHIRCNLCDCIDDAPMSLLKDIEDRISSVTDYRIIGHRLEFFGLCPECAKHMISPGLKKLLKK